MRTEAVLLAAVMVVAAGGAGLAGATLASEAATDAEPGARLSGVLGSQNATIAGEVERRAFATAFNRAGTDSAKAGVVKRQAETVEKRIETLHERKQNLTARYENGTLPESAYRARMATLAAQIATLSDIANTTAEHAGQLPEAALREKDVNASRLETLRRNAANLSGPEVAAIARGVAGGPPPHAGPPDDQTRGPPDNRTTGPPENKTTAPDDRADDNRTTGPPENKTAGSDDRTDSPSDRAAGNRTTGQSDRGPDDNLGQDQSSTGGSSEGSQGSAAAEEDADRVARS